MLTLALVQTRRLQVVPGVQVLRTQTRALAGMPVLRMQTRALPGVQVLRTQTRALAGVQVLRMQTRALAVVQVAAAQVDRAHKLMLPVGLGAARQNQIPSNGFLGALAQGPRAREPLAREPLAREPLAREPLAREPLADLVPLQQWLSQELWKKTTPRGCYHPFFARLRLGLAAGQTMHQRRTKMRTTMTTTK